MTRTFIYAVIFLYAFLYAPMGYAQNPFEKETAVFANATDAEKIYLQLSGTNFNTTETIWFKAIVTDVLNHFPTTKSGVLHVELIDPIDNQIVDKNLLKIEEGVANGFFQLHSSYREGRYFVRAYTEWNKNFGSDFITSIPINLYQLQKIDAKPHPIQDIVFTKDQNSSTFSLSSTVTVKELDSLTTDDAMLYMQWKGGKDSLLIKYKKREPTIKVQHKVPLGVPILNYRLQTKNEVFTKSIVLDDEYGSLQFFPEGGSLVEGLESVVGFKYVDYRGKGAEIQGKIVDENNTEVAKFKSNALGMGKIILTPDVAKTYYGRVTTDNGNTFTYELPKAKKRGQVLSLRHRESTKEVSVWNKDKNKDSLFIKVFHRGKNLFLIKARFKNGAFSYKLPPKVLPHGVIGLTVFDKNYRPVAERHFFNQSKKRNLDITIKTDKERYAARDSVQVSITTRHNNQFVPASVSLMAVDSSYFYGTHLDRNTIVSYFLLQSDIKGAVENPSYYFENNKNLAELDFLMLTQGWTNYKYKEKKKPTLINAEEGLEIKGTVNNVQSVNKRGESKKSKYSLDMLIMGDPFEAYTLETDSTGYFKFVLSDSYGFGRKFVIQPSDASNKESPLNIDIKKYEAPEIAYASEKIMVPVDRIIEEKMIQKIEEDIKIDPFLLYSTIALDEVQLSTYKVTPERAEMVALHGMPDKVINNKELINKQKNWTKSLYKWLLFNYSREIRVRRIDKEGGLKIDYVDVNLVGNGQGFEIAYVNSAGFTYVVVDGMPVKLYDYSLIADIPVNAVKSVEILRNTETANRYFGDVFDCTVCTPPPFPAILAIYTYSGKGLFGAFPKQKITNLMHDTAPQYSLTREYYTPEYHESSKIDWNVPDRRTLLHWEPNILINTNGQVKTTFFNSDLTGKMVLIGEGITSSGNVGYAELFYEVDDP